MIKIRIPSTVSLAKKAGKLVHGEDNVKNAIRSGAAALVIIALDTGANTSKSITDSCAYYNIKYVSAGTKEELGHCVGKSFTAAVAICDEGFAKSIEKAFAGNINGGEVL